MTGQWPASHKGSSLPLRAPIFGHGLRLQFTTSMGTSQSHALFATCQPHQSTSFGSVSGTTSKHMRPSLFRGPNDSRIRSRNGFRKRLRITSPTRFPSRATAVGKAWNHSGHGPTSRDKRAQAWVFAFCVHTFSLGTLLRKGTITGMPQASPTTDPEIDAGEAGDHYAVDFF